MQHRRARTHSLRLTTTVVAVVALSGLVAVPGFAADEAEVYLVQGLPDLKVDVSIDGRTVARDVATTAR